MKKIYIFISVLFLLTIEYQGIKAQDTAYNSKKILLDEMVIHANRVQELKKDVPQQMQVISLREIQTINARNTADLLAVTACVTVQKSQQGGGSPNIRGFEANRVLLVIDGVRMNNIIYRAGHLQNVITIDQSVLDHVEVLYGPSSSQFGSDALGGTMLFFTRKPELSTVAGKPFTKTNAFLRFGTVNGEQTAHIDFILSNTKFGSLTSLTFSSFGDLIMGINANPFDKEFGERPYYADRINGKDSLVLSDNKYLQKFSAYKQYDLMQKLIFKQSARTTHLLNLQFSNSSDVPRYDRLTDPKGTGLKSAEWYYGPQLRALAAVETNHTCDGLFQNIHSIIHYQYVEESRHDRKFGNNQRNNRYEYVNVYGFDLDASHKKNKQEFSLGFDANFNTLKSRANTNNILTGELAPLDTRYPAGNNYMWSAGIYGHHKWDISKKLFMSEGVRLGYSFLHVAYADTSFYSFPFSSVDQKNPIATGSVGLTFMPQEKWKFAANISSAYRVPNVDDAAKVFESSPGMLIVPNPDIKPERTLGIDFNLTHYHNKTFKWENVIFATLLQNAITLGKYTFNGMDSVDYEGTKSQVMANKNEMKAYVLGGSSIVQADFCKNFSLFASINYTYGRIKTDSSDYPLDRVPPLFGRISLEYHKNALSALFYINYNGWKTLKDYNYYGEDNIVYASEKGTPAWFTLNLASSCQLTSRFTVQAGVENILDTMYRTFSSGINAAGRNIFISLRGTF